MKPNHSTGAPNLTTTRSVDINISRCLDIGGVQRMRCTGVYECTPWACAQQGVRSAMGRRWSRAPREGRGARRRAKRPQGARRMRRAGGQGCDTCVARASRDGRPGLERSTDCVAQWPHWACAQQGLRSAMPRAAARGEARSVEQILREHVTNSRGGGFFSNAHSSTSTSTQHVTDRGIARCVLSRGRSATTLSVRNLLYYPPKSSSSRTCKGF